MISKPMIIAGWQIATKQPCDWVERVALIALGVSRIWWDYWIAAPKRRHDKEEEQWTIFRRLTRNHVRESDRYLTETRVAGTAHCVQLPGFRHPLDRVLSGGSLGDCRPACRTQQEVSD